MLGVLFTFSATHFRSRTLSFTPLSKATNRSLDRPPTGRHRFGVVFGWTPTHQIASVSNWSSLCNVVQWHTHTRSIASRVNMCVYTLMEMLQLPFFQLFWAVDLMTTFSTSMHILNFAFLRLLAIQQPRLFQRITKRGGLVGVNQSAFCPSRLYGP